MEGREWSKQARKILTQQCLGGQGKTTQPPFCDGFYTMEHDVFFIVKILYSVKHGHRKTLETNFCLVRLCNGRTQIYRLVVELPPWNGALICYGLAVHQLLGGSSTTKSGAFSRRAKKAGAQQLALKFNASRNPAALRLAVDDWCRSYISNTNDADYCSLPALGMRGIAAFLFSALFLPAGPITKGRVSCKQGVSCLGLLGFCAISNWKGDLKFTGNLLEHFSKIKYCTFLVWWQ